MAGGKNEGGSMDSVEDQGVKLVREFVKDMNRHQNLINILFLLLGIVLGLLKNQIFQ